MTSSPGDCTWTWAAGAFTSSISPPSNDTGRVPIPPSEAFRFKVRTRQVLSVLGNDQGCEASPERSRFGADIITQCGCDAPKDKVASEQCRLATLPRSGWRAL